MTLRECGEGGNDREMAYCGQRRVACQDGIAFVHRARYKIGHRKPVLHKRKFCFMKFIVLVLLVRNNSFLISYLLCIFWVLSNEAPNTSSF